MRRIFGFAVIFCMVFSFSGPALADIAQNEIGGGEEDQKTADPPLTSEVPADSWMKCHQMGKLDGGNISTGGSAAAGVAGGILLGLIGTGLVVLLQSDSDPSILSMGNLEGDECRYAYIEAYQNESASKKRKSALIGGLIGTAVLVLIVVASSGS